MPKEAQVTSTITVNFASQGNAILTWKTIFPEKKKHDKTEESLSHTMSSRPIKTMLSLQQKHSS